MSVARKIAGLPRETLEEVLLATINLCYLVEDDDGNLVYDPEGDINGGDLVDGLTQLLGRHGLIPPEGPAVASTTPPST